MSEKFLVAKLTIGINDEIYQIRQYLTFETLTSYYFEVYKKVEYEEDDDTCEDYDEEEEEEYEFEKILLDEIENNDVKKTVNTAIRIMKEKYYSPKGEQLIEILLSKEWIMDNIDYFEDVIYTTSYEDETDIEEELYDRCNCYGLSFEEFEEIDFYSIKEYFEIESIYNMEECHLEDVVLEKIREEISGSIPENWIGIRGGKFCLNPSNTEMCMYLESLSDFMDGLDNNYEYLVENESDLDDFKALMFKLEFDMNESNHITISSDLNNNSDKAILFVDIDDEDDLVTRLKNLERFKERTGCKTNILSRNSDGFEIIRVFLP